MNKTDSQNINRKKGHLYFSVLVSLGLLIGLALLPAKAESASLLISPASGSFVKGEIFSVKIEVESISPINSAQAVIHFPSDKLEIVEASRDNSLFSLWPEEPSSLAGFPGSFSLIGGLPHPGFTGRGAIVEIRFKVKESGFAAIEFGESHVLADDGAGTELLLSMKEAKYYLLEEPALPPDPPSQAGEQPVVFSPTHPQEEQWYSNRNPVFQWPQREAVESVSFVLDRDPSTVPDVQPEDIVWSKEYQGLENGIWYFHLRLKESGAWSETAHLRVRIDFQPPQPFEIAVDNQDDLTNPSPLLYFEAEDEVSGVDLYKIKIDKDDFFALMKAQINPFSLPNQGPGSHSVIVRAADKAGNNIESRAELEIAPIEGPVISYCPDIYRAGEETFYLTGTALPNCEIILYLEKEGRLWQAWETFSNDKGEWSFWSRELLKPGDYSLLAKARDARGALSEFSTKNNFQVSLSGFALGPLLVSFRQLIIGLALALFLALFAFIYFIRQVSQAKSRLHKETKEAKDSLNRAFDLLEKKLEKKIEMIDNEPGFNYKERDLFSNMKKDLKEAKSSIRIEVADIERVLKKRLP